MPDLSWLKIVHHNSGELKDVKVQPEPVKTNELSTDTSSLAADTLAQIVSKRNASIKILVVGDGTFSGKLSDYAIKMGQHLDCEIIALSVFDKHCQDQREPEPAEIAEFKKRAGYGSNNFASKAIAGGLKFQQLIRIGERENSIEQVINEITGVRYVLSEPDNDAAEI